MNEQRKNSSADRRLDVLAERNESRGSKGRPIGKKGLSTLGAQTGPVGDHGGGSLLHRIKDQTGERFAGSGVLLLRPAQTAALSPDELPEDSGKHLKAWEKDALAFVLSSFAEKENCILQEGWGCDMARVIMRKADICLDEGSVLIVSNRPDNLMEFKSGPVKRVDEKGLHRKSVNLVTYHEIISQNPVRLDYLILDMAEEIPHTKGMIKWMKAAKHILAVTPTPYRGSADIGWNSMILKVKKSKLAQEVGYELIDDQWRRLEWMQAEDALILADKHICSMLFHRYMRSYSASMNGITIHEKRVTLNRDQLNEYGRMEIAHEILIENMQETAHESILLAKFAGFHAVRRWLQSLKMDQTVIEALKSNQEGCRTIICLEALDLTIELNHAEAEIARAIAARLDESGIETVIASPFEDMSQKAALVRFRNDAAEALICHIGQPVIDRYTDISPSNKSVRLIVPTLPLSQAQFFETIEWARRLAGDGRLDIIFMFTDTMADSWNRQVVANHWTSVGGLFDGSSLRLDPSIVVDGIEGTEDYEGVETRASRYSQGRMVAIPASIGAEK